MGTFIILLVAAVLYFFPSIVAANRKHPNADAICVINFFLGWSIIGWVGALAWAFTAVKKSPSEEVKKSGLMEAASLYERGLLSKEQFEQIKNKTFNKDLDDPGIYSLQSIKRSSSVAGNIDQKREKQSLLNWGTFLGVGIVIGIIFLLGNVLMRLYIEESKNKPVSKAPSE
jgi:hypothetical protein